MNLNVFIPLAFAVSSVIALVVFVSSPAVLWYLFGFFVVAALFGSWSFCRQAKNYFGWWQFALLPIMVNIVTTVYLVIVADRLVFYLFATLVAVFNYIYWRYLYFYLNNHSRYQSFSLEFLSFYLSFILVFLAAAALFGLKSFLELSSWLTLGSLAIFLMLVIYQFAWISKYDNKESWLYLLAAWVFLVELFAVLLYLPLNYNILGFVFATGYYLLLVIINDRLKNKLAASRLKIYISVSLAVSIVALLSARWI